MILLRSSVVSHRQRPRTARSAQAGAPRAAHTAEPSGSVRAQRGPLPLSALTASHAHPVVVGLLRPDLSRWS